MADAKMKYTLAELLDVGLKMLQFKVEDALQIKTVAVDPREKDLRVSRIMRHVAKEGKKRDERHVRHDEQRAYRDSLTNEDGKVVISLSEETTDTSRETLAEMALAQQIAAQEVAVQQLVRATAVSASVAAAAAALQKQAIQTQGTKVKSKSVGVLGESRVASKGKVKLSLSSSLNLPNSMNSSPRSGLEKGSSRNSALFQTVMLRNIPNKYTREQLLARFNEKFKSEFDLLYLPIDFHHKCNIGYVFLNFKRYDSVTRFMEEFDGRDASECLPEYNSSKVCEVTPAHVQGLDLMIEHLRASPIAEQLRSKSDWQPLLFDEQGEPMPFPLNPNKTKTSSPPLSGKSSKKVSMRSSAHSRVKKTESVSATTSPQSKEDDSETKERESFPMKEKRRKEKNKRTAEDAHNQALEPCTVNCDAHTTAMVRYIPEELTRSKLNERLCNLLSLGSYNFLYMPIDFEKGTNVGYFFINFCDKDALKKCVDTFHNVVAREVFTDSTCDDFMEVSAARVQGLETNISNLQNSSVGAIAGTSFEWKPLLFSEDGASEELDLVGQGQDSSARRKTKKKEGAMMEPLPPAKKSKNSTTDKRHAWTTGPSQTAVTDYENFKTVMLRHLPNKYTCLMLQNQLNKMGFAGTYDLLYLPIDSRNKCNIGYAFINFRTNEGVMKCFKAFQGVDCTKCLPGFNSNKVVEVTPARMQGLEANVRHMQNSSAVELLLTNPDWAPLVLNRENQPIEYPWKEVIHSKLNALAKPFAPPENVAMRGMPSLSEIVSPQSFEHLLSTRWMLAMEFMYRSSLQAMYNSGVDEADVVNPAVHTTVMIRNIPNKFTRDKLFQKIKSGLPENSIDFFYVPIDLKNRCNMGYCFVNFRTSDAVQKCVEMFHHVKSSVCLPSFNSAKVCLVTPARRQGLHENVSHLVNESVVFQTLTKRGLEEWLPMQFDAFGNEVPFPRGVNSTSKRDISYYRQVLDVSDPAAADYTTIMVRGFGPGFRRRHLVDELEKVDLKGEFDFLYLPTDVSDLVGCAFINFTSKDAVKRAVAALNMRVVAEQTLEVTPARVQGLDSNVRYLSTAFPEEQFDVDSESSPTVYNSNGEVLPFPSMPDSGLRPEAPVFKPQAAMAVS